MALLIIMTLLPVVPTIYLLYVRFNKKKLAAIKKKHSTGAPNFELYRVLYSTETLAAVGFFSSISVVYLISKFYQNAYPQEAGWSALLALVCFALLNVTYFWLRRKNKRY
jgi:ABC-type sugar transport system permease subunit